MGSRNKQSVLADACVLLLEKYNCKSPKELYDQHGNQEVSFSTFKDRLYRGVDPEKALTAPAITKKGQLQPTVLITTKEICDEYGFKTLPELYALFDKPVVNLSTFCTRLRRGMKPENAAHEPMKQSAKKKIPTIGECLANAKRVGAWQIFSWSPEEMRDKRVVG